MTLPKQPTPWALMIGSACMMAGIVGDSFLRLPDPLVFTLLGMGLVFMFTGIRTLRRQKRGEPTAPLDRRHKRFGIVFLSLLAGFVAGYFLIHHDHPEFSVAFSISSASSAFYSPPGIMAWQIYRPRRGEKPNQARRRTALSSRSKTTFASNLQSHVPSPAVADPGIVRA